MSDIDAMKTYDELVKRNIRLETDALRVLGFATDNGDTSVVERKKVEGFMDRASELRKRAANMGGATMRAACISIQTYATRIADSYDINKRARTKSDEVDADEADADEIDVLNEIDTLREWAAEIEKGNITPDLVEAFTSLADHLCDRAAEVGLYGVSIDTQIYAARIADSYDAARTAAANDEASNTISLIPGVGRRLPEAA